MSIRKLLTPGAITPFLGALVLVSLAFGWNRETAAASATGTLALPQGEACPLTIVQQKNSVAAWKKMMPVFRHPRCTNCHGGIPDPLPGKGGATRKHVGVVDMDSTDTEKVCSECHVEGWRLSELKWVERTDTEICSFQKSLFTSAEFIDHIVRDLGGTPFIEFAFEGLRGLNDGAGKSAMEEDLKRPYTPAPPPGTHAQLIQLAKAWVAAQGGRFVGDNQCGCVIPETGEIYQLVITLYNDGGFPGIMVTDSVSMRIRIEDTTVTVSGINNSASRATPEKLSFTVPVLTVSWIPDPLGLINIVGAVGNLALDFPTDGSRSLMLHFTHAGTRMPQFEHVGLRNFRQKEGGAAVAGFPNSVQFELVAGKKVYDNGPPRPGIWLATKLTLVSAPPPAPKPKPKAKP